MDTLKIRIIMEYEFRCGTNAAQTERYINNVYGEIFTTQTRYWFARFRSGSFDLKNEPQGRPDTLVNNDELKAIVEANETKSTAELAAAFDVSIKTILVHLRQIGKLKKLDLLSCPTNLTIETCLALLNRQTNEGILNRIVTCDEKWIVFDNRKHSASWLDPGSAPKQCPKRT